MSVGARRRARCFALQVLYALDINRAEDPNRALATYSDAFDLDVVEPSLSFAYTLVRMAAANRDDIDTAIQKASRNWRIERMSRVDRNILRLATCELRHTKDAPIRVVINEAVELAKLYGAGESAAFVNGILDRIAQMDQDPTESETSTPDEPHETSDPAPE